MGKSARFQAYSCGIGVLGFKVGALRVARTEGVKFGLRLSVFFWIE